MRKDAEAAVGVNPPVRVLGASTYDCGVREDPGPDLGRYHRQMLLPGFGEAGQRRLLSSHAVLIGCGALGTVVAEALARAGVGRLTIVDRDVVEFTNLQRQVLFDEDDARQGTPKSEAAARRLGRVNSSIHIEPVVADVNPRNAEALCAGAKVIVDGTDNFGTRYLLNDVCVKSGVPLVYGGVVGTAGMTMTIIPGSTPCLRCVFPDPPAPGSAPTCDTAGVLGPVAGAVASAQAVEAIKVLLGRADLVRPVLSTFDLWNGSAPARAIDLSGFDRSACPCCGVAGRLEFLEGAAADTAALCGADAVQVLPTDRPGVPMTAMDLEALAQALGRGGHGPFEVGRFMLRGSVGGFGLTVFRDGRAIVKGTTDLARARSVYARFVGA